VVLWIRCNAVAAATVVAGALSTRIEIMHTSGLRFIAVATLSLSACGDDKNEVTGDTVTTTQTSSTSSGTTEAASTGEPATGSTSTGTTATPTTGEPITTGTPLDTSTGGESTGSSSTGGESSTTNFEGLSLAADVYPMWNPPARCDCHTPGSGGLKMGTVDEAFMNLVGVPAQEAPDLSRIEPGDREASYLWHKINGTHVEVGGSGNQMPLGAPPLDPAIVDLIGQWIDDGAHK
jgi:hypothetical protein